MKDKVSALSKLIRIITLLWNYFTVLSLISFGITFLKYETTIPYAIVVFSFGLLYLILTTAVFVVGPKKKRESQDKKDKRKLLTFFYKVVKVFIIILPLFTLNPDLTKTFAFPKLTTIFSLIWLGITIGLEIWIFIMKRTLKLLGKGIKKIVLDNDKEK